jgi:Na+-driven multidrug efflux pump
MYANFIFAAIYLGYSMGSAPITSYNYGAGNHSELKNMLKKSLSLITVTGVCLTLISEFFAHPLINIFVGYDANLFAMTLHGFRLYALVFLINGFNIWASSFFTALNNGVVSGMIAFLRTLLFQIGCIMLLPLLLGLNGIWIGVVVAELLTLIVTIYFLRSRKKVYHY